jgi:hypothetical protein
MSRRIWATTFLIASVSATAAWAEDPVRPSLAAAVLQAAAQNQPAKVAPAAQDAVPPSQPPDPGWEVEIAPIYLWAPFNISTVTLPEFPNLPEPPPGSDDGGRATGETDTSLNGAAMAAVRVEKNWWMLRTNFVWAGLSSEREQPRIKLSGDLVLGELVTGVEVVKSLYVEGGVRRLAVEVDAEVLDYPKVSRKPGVWDPIIGMTFRRPLGSKWLLQIHGDGGGFGVGSEVDLAANLTLDWRPASHFGLTLGYGYLYFRLQDKETDRLNVEQTLELGTTLHGPILGFKLLF